VQTGGVKLTGITEGLHIIAGTGGQGSKEKGKRRRGCSFATVFYRLVGFNDEIVKVSIDLNASRECYIDWHSSGIKES
jgi:hypothetical protein